jgi:hypothetical protein
MANLFERLSGTQPPPAQLEKKDHKRRQDEEDLILAQRLLSWLQKWPKDILSLRDICVLDLTHCKTSEKTQSARPKFWYDTGGSFPKRPTATIGANGKSFASP